MNHHVIDFVPPVLGIQGLFNTFRLGLFYSKRLTAGDTVYLMDSKEKKVIGTATVSAVHVGRLEELLDAHSLQNHAVIHLPSEQRQEALRGILTKFYGPHIATPNRKGVAVYLARKQ